nr:hypothetical protein [Acidobacteriota bacterium]
IVGDINPAEARRPAEVSVAINPTNPGHIVAAMLQSGALGQPRVSNWTYTSMDVGRRWTGAPAHNPDHRVQGDDVVTFNRDGVAYHSYISGVDGHRPAESASRRGEISSRHAGTAMKERQ